METSNFKLTQLREIVLNGDTRALKWRENQLKQLKNLIENHESEILQALKSDIGKPKTEAFFEIIALKQELKYAFSNLKNWMKPSKVQVPLSLQPGSAFQKFEPLGCVLIIGPWNYPFSLTLQPLISAFAAGNTAVLKPSENAPATSKLISKLTKKYFPENILVTFEGDGKVAEELISKSFDHIFFTGGGEVGKKVMKSAANHLTPVTLELGGKSPAVIFEDADIEVAGRRLAWGKSLNAGQTCIAPDHLIVENKVSNKLIESIKNAIFEFHGEAPLKSNNLAKIINKHHFNRLKNLLENAKNNKQVIFGGDIDESSNKISPTIINIKDRNDPLMKEEIFGPLIPVLNFLDFNNVIKEINQQPKPLAIYIFGGGSIKQEEIIQKTSSGSVCINDVVLQAGIPELSFGGVGQSGIGNYHGYAGFKTFSHEKSILKKPFWLDVKFRYPPYNVDIDILKKLF